MVEDEVPCAVSEGVALAQFRDDGRQAGLRRRDPLGGFVWMLEMTQVIVGGEPASLPVVPGDVLVLHEEDSVVGANRDVLDELVNRALGCHLSPPISDARWGRTPRTLPSKRVSGFVRVGTTRS